MRVSKISWLSLSILVFVAALMVAEAPVAQENEGSEQAEDPALRQAATEDEDPEARPQRRGRRRGPNVVKMNLGDEEISLMSSFLTTDSPDYAGIAALQDGEVLGFTQSAVLKLKTKPSIRLADALLRTSNVSEGYAGVYGLWLKKTGAGWRIVITEKPDVWGTMFRVEDVFAEIAVDYRILEESVDSLTLGLSEEGEGGILSIAWGEHRWSTAFSLATDE